MLKLKYKVTKQDDKYYIRNTETNKLYKTAYNSYEEAISMLSIRPEVVELQYLLDKEMIAKLKPLYEIMYEIEETAKN